MLLGDGGAGVWAELTGTNLRLFGAPAGGAVAFSLVAVFLNHCPAASPPFVSLKPSTLLTRICRPRAISTQTIIGMS